MPKQMSESEFTAKVCAELEAVGAKVYVLAGSAVSSGLPDRLVVHRDWAGLLEFKRAGGVLRGNQRLTIGEVRKRGFGAWVVRQIMVMPNNPPTSWALEDRLGNVQMWGYGGKELLQALRGLK